MIALRYLRARRKASFVSVIAFFSFLGIALGVATLIVVMSVMNGFHKELLDKIVGINGHIFLQAADTQFTDYDEVVNEVAAVPGVKLVIPMIESPAAASTSHHGVCPRAGNKGGGHQAPARASPTMLSSARSTVLIRRAASRSAKGSPKTSGCVSATS